MGQQSDPPSDPQGLGSRDLRKLRAWVIEHVRREEEHHDDLEHGLLQLRNELARLAPWVARHHRQLDETRREDAEQSQQIAALQVALARAEATIKQLEEAASAASARVVSAGSDAQGAVDRAKRGGTTAAVVSILAALAALAQALVPLFQ